MAEVEQLKVMPLLDSTPLYLAHFTCVEALWICVNLCHADEEGVVRLLGGG